MIANDCPLPPGSRVVAYFRDSGGEDQERSVEQQHREAQAYCARFHLVLVRVFGDEAKVGSTVVGRDGFDELMHFCRQLAPEGKPRDPTAPDGVLLWDMKRFARNHLDNAFFKGDLRRRGYTLIFLSDNIPEGDAGIIYEAMLEWKAQQDLADISKDVKRGLADLVGTRDADGNYLGLCPGRRPTGFQGEPYTLGIKRDGQPRVVQRLVPDPEIWDTCRRAWEMRLAGTSYTKIHGATRLFKSTGCYATFFRNRIYTGTLEYGGKEYPDFVPALVTQEEWEIVQQMRKPRAERRPRLDSSDYPLSGIAFCGLCTRPMKADSIPAREDGGDGYPRNRHRRYTCTGWKYYRDCTQHYATAETVEAAVFQVVSEQILRPEHLFQVWQDAQPGEQERQELEQRIRRLKADSASIRQVIARLVDAVEKTGFSPTLAERLAEREAERALLDSQVSELRGRLQQTETTVPIEVLEEFCAKGQVILAQGAVDDVRDLLRAFIVRVEIEPRRGRLIYSFPTAGL